jgi:hypothetical protein
MNIVRVFSHASAIGGSAVKIASGDFAPEPGGGGTQRQKSTFRGLNAAPEPALGGDSKMLFRAWSFLSIAPRR